MTTTAAPDTRTAPLPLWRSAGAFITTLFNLFGAPQDLAADHTLTTKTHALILSWLRVAEAFLRHLLLIEASALDCGSCGAPALARRSFSEGGSSRHYARERKRVEFFANEPETWRVSFRCFPSSPACGGSVIGKANDEGGAPAQALDAFAPHRTLSHASRDSSPARGGAKFHSAWPIAERFEALLRVYNNPAPYARRLARRLRALPRLIATVLHKPTDFEHRLDEDTRVELDAHIDRAKPELDSS
ncbi:hypothetical protein [Terricaulis silvestris]|uniref:hypothetical protein n=1 Tax=Terricaulis silvestris TaxID=2686094 RepID=UPI00131DCB54|nr:hypothetical protein [Terricaulis silvestris]